MTDTETASDVTLYVCATCRPEGHDDAQPRPGALLARALAERAGGGVAVKAVQCLSACKRPCAVAFSGPGRFTYVVADADPDVHVDDLLRYARAYGESRDGITVWRERPEIVKRSVVARVPAPGQVSSLVADMPADDSTARD